MQLEGGASAGISPAVPDLVGRDQELGQVRWCLAAAEGGRGSVVILRGEAGIGKTRLVGEITGDASARGMAVRSAEASEFEQTRPFGVICDALGVSPRAPDPALAGLARRIAGTRHGPGASRTSQWRSTT